MDEADPRSEFLQQVEEDLEKASRAAGRYRSQYRRMAVGGVLSASLAAVLTGGAAAGGPELADAVGGWRLVCTVAAVAAAVAAALAGLQERLRTPENVAAAETCVAQLNALRFALRTGEGDLDARRTEYREILRNHSKFMVTP